MTGTVEFAYDLEKRTLLNGEFLMEGEVEKTLDLGRATFPIEIQYRIFLEVRRELGEKSKFVEGIEGETEVFASMAERTPLPACSMAEKDAYLLANWDGGESYEVMNRFETVKKFDEPPTAAAISGDAKYIVIANDKRALFSSNYGEDFGFLKLRRADIAHIEFLKSEKPTALIMDSKGKFYTLDFTARSPREKPLPIPAAGKDVLWPNLSGPRQRQLLHRFERCNLLHSRRQTGKGTGNAVQAATSSSAPAPDGAFAVADGLYKLTPSGDKVQLQEVPDNVKQILATEKKMMLLTKEGKLFTSPVEGGELAEEASGIRSMALKFGKFFAATDTGVTIK
ncbi:MAG: hypothetical protein U5N86_13105 [Planctomycetota bacterium]|nr:hypothetical protein [Planctomycetota bacterium]